MTGTISGGILATAEPTTPYLQYDRTALLRNIERMADWATSRNVKLRPHVKTHKSVEFAKLQIEAGAVGITVATIGEAEVFAAAGFDDIFIAYPLWVTSGRAERLNALSKRIKISIGVDSTDSLTHSIPKLDPRVSFVIEVDSGHHRSGTTARAVRELAMLIASHGRALAGIFTFPGHSYAPDGRHAAALGESDALAVAAEMLRASGFPDFVVSGGSTPSVEFSDTDTITELRPGVYLFNDAQQWELGSCSPSDISLWAVGTVISKTDGRIVLDVGSKTLGADRAAYSSGYGRLLDLPEARVVMLSEHHSVIELNGHRLPRLGEQLRIVPNHVCNAINLHDSLFDLNFQAVAINARGRNS